MKPVFAFIAFLVSAPAVATSQCPPEAACDQGEFPLLMAASLDGMKNVCARLDPSRQAQYSAALERMLDAQLSGEDRAALGKARSSPHFAIKLKEAEKSLQEKMQSDELARECAALLDSAAKRPNTGQP